MVDEGIKKMIDATVNMRCHITGSDLDEQEILQLFLRLDVSDHFRFDKGMGGYVPHQKKLHRRMFY